MVSHSKFALSHALCRERVCFGCFGRADRCFQDNPVLKASISKYFKISFDEGGPFDLRNPQVPLGICSSCRLKISTASDGEHGVLANQSFSFVGDVSACETSKCVICQIVKNTKVSNLRQNGIGKGKIRKAKVKTFTTAITCTGCLSIISKGVKHHCTEATLASQIKKKLDDPSSGKAGEVVASSVLKKAPRSADGQISLKQASGRPLKVTPGKASPDPSPPKGKVSVSKVLEFQVNKDLGDGQTRDFCTFINKQFGKGTVEKDFQKKLSLAYKFFEKDFICSPTSFCTNGQTPTIFESFLVHVPSLSDFVLKILQKRGSDPQAYSIKLGVDKGQGILKFTLTLVPKGSEDDVNGYTENCFAKQGVNDIFLVAVCSGVEENHYNLRTILNMIKAFECGDVIFTGDLKVINMLCGIQAHSCMHPCYACTQHKDHLDQDSCLRTVESTLANFDNYQNSSRTAAECQAQNNVKNFPIISLLSPTQGSLPLLFLIPPPELHLMLGPFKDFFNATLEIFPEAVQWPQEIFKNQKPYHGGEFVGNDCRDLLKNVDTLERLAYKYSKLQALQFVRLFRAFRDVIKSCFGGELHQDYLDRIDEFKTSLFATGMRITPKMHIIIFHIPQWCGHFKKSLGLYSEQTLESSHKKFKKYFDRYKVAQLNPRFGEQLKSAVCSFNSKALFHQLFQQAKESGEPLEDLFD